MNQTRNRQLPLLLVVPAVLALCLLTAGPAAAQYATGFDSTDGFVGAPDGSVPIDGQNGWYAPAGSTSQAVYTYDSNALGLPANPTGGDQFVGASGTSDGSFARAQVDIDFSGSAVWTVAYDECASHLSGTHFVNNLSSFSLQDSNVSAYFIGLNFWHKHDNLRGKPVRWNAVYEVFDNTGAGPFLVKPPKSFLKLQQGNWYRQSTTFDLSQNQVLAISLTDLSTGNTVTYSPTGWYLAGGPGGGGLPIPTAIRFFVGGGTGTSPGNIMGFDNLSITPGGPAQAVGGKVTNATGEAKWLLPKQWAVD